MPSKRVIASKWTPGINQPDEGARVKMTPMRKPRMPVTWARVRWWVLMACLEIFLEICSWQLPVKSGFTGEQYDRFRLGMSLAEVTQTLRVPPASKMRAGVHYDLITQTWQSKRVAYAEMPLALFRP